MMPESSLAGYGLDAERRYDMDAVSVAGRYGDGMGF